MAHRHRFYVSPDSVSGDAIVLDGEEAHHLIHVLRLKEGEVVDVFDGDGAAWSCTVATISRRDVTLAIAECREPMQPPAQVTLLQAYLGREKAMEALIQRCTELGVCRFVFFAGDHSQRHRAAPDKWRKWALESCKQCGWDVAPAFESAESLEAALAVAGGTVLMADLVEAPRPIRAVVQDGPVTLIVGPEGDLSDGERATALNAKATPISLGSATLRAEVAAATATTLVLYELGALGPRGTG